MSKTLALCLLAGTVFSQALFAQQPAAQEQRWFEIELIVFSQNPADNLQESFVDSITPIKPGRAIDLLSPRYQPDISALLLTLPLCLQQNPALAADSFTPAYMSELCILEQQLPPWQHNHLFEARQLMSQVPFPHQLQPVVAGNGQHQQVPYLADASALQLTDVASRITRQTGKQLLLHTAWRQAPVTQRLAIATRWYSGSNYFAEFDYWGQSVPALAAENISHTSSDTQPAEFEADKPPSDNDMLQHIEQLLQLLAADRALPELASTDTADIAGSDSNSMSINTLPQQVWQLDGLFKLHLDHYLFVNTEFNLRVPQADKLQTIYVRQSRRVISGEVHYLDHPYLGIVLQIRRYEPTEPQPDDENVTEDLPEQP